MKKRVFIVILSVLVLLGASCGPGEDGENGNGGRTPTGLDVCSVKLDGWYYLGLAMPCTGSLAEKAASRELAVLLAINEINEAGGVHGKLLGLVSCDTQKDPTVALQRVQELVGVPEVVGVIGPATSSSTLEAAPAAIAEETVLVSPSATSPEITGLDDDGCIFRTAMSDAFQGVALAAICAERGYEDVLVVHRDDAYGSGLKGVFLANLQPEISADAVAYDVALLDPAAVVAAVEAGEPDVVLLISYVDDGSAIIKSVLDAGLDPEWLLTDGNKSPDLLEKIGGADRIEGATGTYPGVPAGPDYEAYHAAYEVAWNQEPLGFSANAYDAAWLLALATALSDDPEDRAAVRDMMASTFLEDGPEVGPGDWAEVLASPDADGFNYNGASGDVDFSPEGDVFSPMEEWQVVDGEIVTAGCWDRTGKHCER